MSDETRPDDHSRPSTQEQTDATAVLRSAQVGYVAVSDGGPYVVPICFAYDPHPGEEGWGRIVFHTGEGRKSQALSRDPRLCLAVVSDIALDRGPEPCSDTFAYRSVLVEGTAVRLEGRAEREEALRLIVAKYDPQAKERPFAEDDFAVTLVYSVTIACLSYKRQSRRS